MSDGLSRIDIPFVSELSAFRTENACSRLRDDSAARADRWLLRVGVHDELDASHSREVSR
jgi:hypothetical protein